MLVDDSLHVVLSVFDVIITKRVIGFRCFSSLFISFYFCSCFLAAPPTNIDCQNTSSGLRVTWEPVIDDASSCVKSDLNYSVTVIRESSNMMTFFISVPVTENVVCLANTTGLDPSTRYFITVSVQVTDMTHVWVNRLTSPVIFLLQHHLQNLHHHHQQCLVQ